MWNVKLGFANIPNQQNQSNMDYLFPRSPVILTSLVVFSKETTLFHHQSTIRQNQRDQLMDPVMKAEAVMVTTGSAVPRPLIVSNAMREYQTTLSRNQSEQSVDVVVMAEAVMMTVGLDMPRELVHSMDRVHLSLKTTPMMSSEGSQFTSQEFPN